MFRISTIFGVFLFFFSCSSPNLESRVPAAQGLQEPSQGPLHQAIAQGDREEVDSLLNSGGVDINGRDDRGYTPIEEAVASTAPGSFDLFIHLVEQGANTERTTRGWGLLHFAAFFGRGDIISFLLERGLPVDGRSTPTLQTPLMVAAGVVGLEERQLEVARVLVNGGADLKLEDNFGRRASDVAFSIGNSQLGDFLKSLEDIR